MQRKMENSKEQIKGKCGLCNSEATLTCSKCRSTYYCNKNCQKSHWKVHKKTCKSILEQTPLSEIESAMKHCQVDKKMKNLYEVVTIELQWVCSCKPGKVHV